MRWSDGRAWLPGLVLAVTVSAALVTVAEANGGPAVGGPDPTIPCLEAKPPPLSAPGHRLRFGVSPEAAGTVGSSQGEVVPEDARKADAAMHRLRPENRALVVRLSRLFMADGGRGIRRLAHRARHFADEGFLVESQVRYHPSPAAEGDMAAWTRFVRRSVLRLGRNPALTALTITNEVNLPISPNTSDGPFVGALRAIVRGIPAAQRALARIGRRDVSLGFSYAYRWLPESDVAFWDDLGDEGTKRFRRALDYVGVQLYPGLFWPPVLTTETAGEATLEAVTLVRDCYMARARLGPMKELWITENGYATNLGHTEARQAAELEDTVRLVRRYSGTLGVSDYRYFNLRDNRPAGTDLFDNVGLLRADYSRKPAFEVYRRLVRQFGRRS
jgi:hypothetical protein